MREAMSVLRIPHGDGGWHICCFSLGIFSFFFLNILSMYYFYVYGCSASMYIWTPHAYNACRGQMRASECLRLESVVNSHVGTGTRTWVPQKKSRVLLPAESPLQLWDYFSVYFCEKHTLQLSSGKKKSYRNFLPLWNSTQAQVKGSLFSTLFSLYSNVIISVWKWQQICGTQWLRYYGLWPKKSRLVSCLPRKIQS